MMDADFWAKVGAWSLLVLGGCCPGMWMMYRGAIEREAMWKKYADKQHWILMQMPPEALAKALDAREGR